LENVILSKRDNHFNFLLNVGFLLIVGVLKALIVNRERLHHFRTNEYKNMLNRDYLTGLYNHRHFQEQLIKHSVGHNVTLVMVDIDFFKKINDTYGHVVGDQVLKQLGQMFNQAIPSSKGLAFRYGGEEFALLFFSNNFDEVRPYISSIYKQLNEMIFKVNQKSFKITLSFGIANQKGLQKGEEELVRLADDLLYEAKNSGKNKAVFSDGNTLYNEVKKVLIHI
jgi:diguanylate cyclase